MKNKFKLKIFPLAQRDIEEIFDYIAIKLCNPTAAIRLINDFEEAFEIVCLFPETIILRGQSKKHPLAYLR